MLNKIGAKGLRLNWIVGTCLCLVALISQFDSFAADNSPSNSKFNLKWKALIGEWKGQDNSGTPSGACGFHFDLGEHVIVRTNLANLPGSAASHTDLMIISPDAGGDKAR